MEKNNIDTKIHSIVKNLLENGEKYRTRVSRLGSIEYKIGNNNVTLSVRRGAKRNNNLYSINLENPYRDLFGDTNTLGNDVIFDCYINDIYYSICADSRVEEALWIDRYENIVRGQRMQDINDVLFSFKDNDDDDL